MKACWEKVDGGGGVQQVATTAPLATVLHIFLSRCTVPLSTTFERQVGPYQKRPDSQTFALRSKTRWRLRLSAWSDLLYNSFSMFLSRPKTSLSVECPKLP